MNRLGYGVGAAAVAALLSTGAIAATGQGPMIKVKDQKVSGKTVTIAEVKMPKEGFLVIHATDAAGKIIAPQHVGYTEVQAGDHKNVKVQLDEVPTPGAKYVAMLHNDTGQKGKYEFGVGHTNVDKPIMQNGKPVTKAFTAKK